MDEIISIVSAAVLLDWYRCVGCIHGDCNSHPASALRGYFQSAHSCMQSWCYCYYFDYFYRNLALIKMRVSTVINLLIYLNILNSAGSLVSNRGDKLWSLSLLLHLHPSFFFIFIYKSSLYKYIIGNRRLTCCDTICQLPEVIIGRFGSMGSPELI